MAERGWAVDMTATVLLGPLQADERVAPRHDAGHQHRPLAASRAAAAIGPLRRSVASAWVAAQLCFTQPP